MRVDNVKVYDLEESLIASGYPMQTSLCDRELEDKDIVRGSKLSHASDHGNPAHGQYLTGIRVSFDLTCSNKMWVEAERYRFLEFVSSQSTMHRITRFDLRAQCNQYVDPRIIDIVERKIQGYLDFIKTTEAREELNGETEEVLARRGLAKDLYLQILYSLPSGFELTARMTTNYRCLKNIYIQRKDHRLPEWREFCKWIETLPYAKELICYDLKEKN